MTAPVLYGFWRSLATFRVRVALNLKGLEARETSIDIFNGAQYDPEFVAVNPMSAVPALVEEGHAALTQSLAIIEYLDETHPAPPLLPPTPRGRAEARALALMVAADAHPLVVPRVRNYLSGVLGLDEPARNAWIAHWSRAALAALEQRLAGRPGPWCMGEQLTLADICLATHVAGAKLTGIDLTDFPASLAIAERALALEPFARAHPLRQAGAPAR